MDKEINLKSSMFKRSIEDLQNADYDSFTTNEERTDYLEALLVAKSCFREWVRDERCVMADYDSAVVAAKALTNEDEKNAALQKAKEDYPFGVDAHVRLTKQVDDLKTIQNHNNTDYFKTVLKALNQNFKEMVEQAKREDANYRALKDHFESEEFKDIFDAIKDSLNFEGVPDNDDKRKAHVVNMAMEAWIEQERSKSNNGQLDAHGWSHERWNKMMNKIPDTAKYNSRGATPVEKKHLSRFLAIIGNDTKYDQLKEKSADFYMARANQLRHEAMEKSNSIIAYVMHKMANGGDMSEMHDKLKGGSADDKMKMKHDMDKMLGHRNNNADMPEIRHH